jgi:hypothetical protein
VCVEDSFPAIKFFSPTDVSSSIPPVTCYRVDKHVAGVSWSDWAGWFKLAHYLDGFVP